MPFLLFARIIFIGLILAFFLFQIMIPLLRGRKLFPMFRESESLEVRARTAQQALDDKIRKEAIEEIEKKVTAVAPEKSVPEPPKSTTVS